MAGRIQGITIEIDGNTTKLSQSLKGIDSQLKNTQSSLKDIDKLLKLDPKNTELLTQKQRNLKTAISETGKRLEELKSAQNGVSEGSDEWDRLQREIIATEQDLEKLKKQYNDFGSVSAQKIAAAGKQMEDFGGKVQKAGEAFAPISAAASGALVALGGIAYKSVTASDDLATLSKQTGFTTDEIQKMKYAADLVDVSFEDISGALKKLKPQITEDNAALAGLGVSVKNADGTTRDATAVFYDAITALSQIENETERDQMAMELFGKGADSLAGIIDDGGAALKEYGKQAEDLGLILSGDTIESLNAVNDTIDTLKAQGGATLAQLGATVAQVFAPALQNLMGLLGKVSEAIAKLTPEQATMITKILAITAAITPLLKTGGKLISGVGKALQLAPKIASAAKIIGGALSLKTLGITALIAGIAALVVVIVKNWDKIKEFTNNMVDGVKNAFENLKTGISNAVENVKTAVSNAWNNLKTTTSNAFNAVKDSVSNAFNGVKSSISSAWDNIRASASSKIGNIKATVSTAFSGIVDRIKSIFSFDFKLPTLKLPTWEDIKGHFNNLITNIKNAFHFDWSLPHVKLPHFKVKGGQWPYGLGGSGYLPSISIDWYKKAYTSPVMFTSPTVMATPQGYKGFGDNGAEIVLGLNKLQELVGGSRPVVVNVYGAKGQSVDELADAVTRRIVNLQKQRNNAYA
jgi:phage-related minor tail protein